MSRIDQNSLIPIGLAVIVIGGGAIWMTKQDMMTTANATEITEIKSGYTFIQNTLKEILHRLSTIEGELKRIPKRRELEER